MVRKIMKKASPLIILETDMHKVRKANVKMEEQRERYQDFIREVKDTLKELERVSSITESGEKRLKNLQAFMRDTQRWAEARDTSSNLQNSAYSVIKQIDEFLEKKKGIT